MLRHGDWLVKRSSPENLAVSSATELKMRATYDATTVARSGGDGLVRGAWRREGLEMTRLVGFGRHSGEPCLLV